MTKNFKRKSLFLILTVSLIITLCAGILVACGDAGGNNDSNKLSITVHYNDGSGKIEVIELAVGQTLPTPTLDGYTFDGWSLDRAGQTPVVTFTDGMTVYAQWAQLRYTVDFYVNHYCVSTQSIAFGESAPSPLLHTFFEYIPNGYVFDGWDTDFSNVTSSLDVNAVLKQANARVRFMSEVGDDRYVISSEAGLIGKPVYRPADFPERKGFAFIGWHKADGTRYSEDDVFEEDTVYYAHWQPQNPNMPAVSGLKTFTYGSPLSLTSGDARSYLGITYDYTWQYFPDCIPGNTSIGRVEVNGKELNLPKIKAGEYTFKLIVTAKTEINGYEDSISNYFDVPVTVKKAKLTATVSPLTVYFEDSFLHTHDLQISYEGFKFDDDESAITWVSIAETDYKRFSLPSREYSFSLECISNNYDVVGKDGLAPSSTATVLKRTLRIKDIDLTKPYDGNVFTKSYSELFMYGTAYADITATVSIATTSANVGNYTLGNGLIVTEMVVYGPERQVITQGFNLDLNLSAQITPATIKYVKPASVVYDGAQHSAKIADIAGATVNYSINGTDYTSEAPSFTNAGTYSVFINIQKDNYQTVDEQFDFVINKANAQIVFDNLTIPFGFEPPQYTYQAVGIDKDMITVNAECAYTDSSPAGEYTITCTMQDTENINFFVKNGKLTVLENGESVKPILSLILDGKFEIVYGETIPTYTVTGANGLIDGDVLDDVINGALSITCDYASTPATGVYSLKISGISSDKYEITTNATLTVKKAMLNITVKDHSPIVYGSLVPTDFEYMASGFKFSDNESLLDGISIGTTYTQRASASQQYDVYVNLNGLTLANYDIETTLKKLTVEKAPTIITLPFDGNLKLNYNGQFYDFLAELNPQSTNTDENAKITLIYKDTLNYTIGKTGGIYKLELISPETENFLEGTASTTVCILSAKIGNALYTLEDALKVGGNITLIGHTFLSQNAEIKQGTTLTLPCREDGTLYAFAACEYGTVNRYIDPMLENLLYELTIEDNITLTVNGTLAVGGEIGQQGGAYQGHTTGMHSIITCMENSQIIVKNGGLVDCIGGFIIGNNGAGGDKLIVNDGGTLKHNFTVLYFRGGTSTVGSFQQGKISPFNVFDMPNIQIQQQINYGAKVIAYCDLYASGSHNTAEVTVVDKDDALFNLSQGSYITAFHDKAWGTATPHLYVTTVGDIRIGSLRLTIDFIISVTVDMSEVICPLSYIIGLNVQSGKLTVANRFKLLPGANITIGSEGTLELLDGGGLIAYTDNWKDSTFVDSNGQPITGSLPGSETWYPHDKGDARLSVAGKLIVNNGAFLAGNVYGLERGEIRISAGALVNATSIEGVAVVGASGSGQVWHKTAEITKTATAVNQDGSTVAMQPNYRYFYTNGAFTANKIS